MVEAAPPAPFIIAEAEFLLELLIIALDPPSQLCQIDQTIEGDILGQGGKPILGRLGFVLPATRSEATLRRAARSARYRDAPAALSAGQSARRANPRFPRAK